MLCKFFFSENRAVYEIMSKNVVEPERPQMALMRRFACWISKAKARARAEKGCYCFSTARMGSRTRHSVTLYVHCLSCFYARR
jgi:hypothetical protein